MSIQPRRRWFRFSMRTMLVCMAIFSIWFGWISHKARQQRKAVEWVEANGGEVWYEDEVILGDDFWDVQLQRGERTTGWIPLPRTWKTGVLRDYEWDVVRADLTALGHVVEDISPLRSLTELQVVDVAATRPQSSVRFDVMGQENSKTLGVFRGIGW